MTRPVSYEKLLRLAHQRAIDGKGGLAASIAKMCLDARADLSQHELELTFQILRQLIDKVEVQIRRHIADYLADRSDVPRDLLAFLTNDAVHVAYPIIVRSQQLSDDDLIRLALERGHGHAIAVASRPEIGESVCEALVGVGEIEIDRTLLRNQHAHIGRGALETLVERSIDASDLRELIVKRPDLPTDLARRMYIWVGDALRQYIAQNFDIDDASIDQAIDDAIAQATQAAIGPQDDAAQQADGAFTDDPAAQRRRQAATLMRVLHRDGPQAFLNAAAEAARLPESAMGSIFAPDSPQTAAIACKALGLDADRFTAVLNAFMTDAAWAGFVTDGGLDKATAYFDRIDPVGAASVLRHWRDRPPGDDPDSTPH